MNNPRPIHLPEAKITRIIWTLLILFPILGMVIDLIAPSLPGISQSLQASSQATKMVISIYLLTYAFGNFVTGFLADAYGRQKLLRWNLVAFILVSLLPVIIPTMPMILLSRALEGFTIGAISVLVRASFADVLLPEKLMRLSTVIATMWGLGPVVGPIIGGYLQAYFGWKAGFIFLASLTLCVTIAVFIIVPETHLERHPLNLKRIGHNLQEVVSHRVFIGTAILMGLSYSLLIAFNTAGPFLIQSGLSYSPIFFGRLALLLGLVFLSATFVGRFLLKHHPVQYLLPRIIGPIFALSAVCIILSYMLRQNVIFVGFMSAVMYFACGLIFPMSMGRGMSLFRHIAGTATALMFLINILITSLTAFAIGFFKINSAISLAWIFGILLALAVLTYRLLCTQKVAHLNTQNQKK